MKVKTLICNCKGLDPYRYADQNSLAYGIESEFEVSYAPVLPQLCTEGGNDILEDVLRAAEDDSDTYVLVCACVEGTHMNFIKKALHDLELDPNEFVPPDICIAANDGILGRIRERLNDLAGPHSQCD
jgi:hypothetical protein